MSELNTPTLFDDAWLAALPLSSRAVVETLAVCEPCDGAMLAALLGLPNAGELGASSRIEGIRVQNGDYTLDPAVAALVNAALRAQPERRRALMRSAVEYGAGRLPNTSPDTHPALEASYMRHLTTLCETLIVQEPATLAAVVDAIPHQHITVPAHRHLIHYYRGLGAGLQERFAAARAEFDDLLTAPDLDDTVRARVLNSSATFARHQGDYEQSLNQYRASYTIWQRLGNRMREGLALMNQGMLHYYLQDYQAAEQALQASLGIFQAVDAVHQQAMAHTNLGLLARDRARWDEATEHFAAAAAIFEREGLVDYLGRVSNNSGEVALLRGQTSAALEHFEQALQQMTTRVYTIDVHLNIGLICQAHDDDAAALEHYETALALATELGREEITALVRYRIGHAQQRLQLLDAACASYAAAIDTIEASRAPLRDEGLMVSLMGRWQQVYEAAVQLSLARGAVTTAFDYAERARARAFADLLSRRGAETAATHATPATAAVTQAALRPGTLLLAYFATGLRGPESALLDAIPRDAASLRACLQTPPQLILFAVRNDALHAFTCVIDPNILQASSPYLADGRRFLPVPVRRRLYRALIAPVQDAISAADQVAIVPHGPLHQLPFVALLGEGDTPLLEAVARVVYAPSATVLLAMNRARSTAPHSCLALGYDGAEGQQLRHTEAEASAVAALSGGVAWQGAAGVRERLREAAGDYRWLHLACHGEFDLDDPLRSWLEIGPDERLSAAEVLSSLDLHADLVTLSACRSGLSRILRGDEPMGLVRAFLMAGARTVLVTLWPVEDTSARLFMEHFYRLLLAGGKVGDPADALYAAQRYLRHLTYAEVLLHLRHWGEEPPDDAIADDEMPYQSPEYWAPYTLVASAAS